MLQFRPLDPSFPIQRQLAIDAAPVILVNVFTMDQADEQTFLEVWQDDAAFMKRQPGFMQLLHLQIPVQAGQIPVSRSRGRVGAKEEVGVPGCEIADHLAHTADRTAVESLAHLGVGRVVFVNFFLEPLAFRRLKPLQHLTRDDPGNCTHLQIFGVEIRPQALHDLNRRLIANFLLHE